MWLIDHQMNVKVGEEFGMYFARIPLKSSPHIVHDNALWIDWQTVLPPERCSYLMGNPPFVGKKEQSTKQKSDMDIVMSGIKGAGVLDFVCAWYVLATRYIKAASVGRDGRHEGIVATRCAFVSTNSITQGEQVGVLWSWLLAHEVKIQFAHRTFKWSNEARGKAAVHCVIIGFGEFDVDPKTIFQYDTVGGEPHAALAHNINPYLVDAVNVLLPKRAAPISDVAEIRYGSMANDDGALILDSDERAELLNVEPNAGKFVRPFIGGFEFLNSEKRWCLWLVNATPSELRQMPLVMNRVNKVRSFREGSGREETKRLSATPALFGEIRQPDSEYLFIPKVSSESRPIMPIGFIGHETIASGSALIVPFAQFFDFAVLQSAMHMAWMRAVAGRMKSDYQYSSQIVYNNFPWPENPTETQKQKIEEAGHAVLDARATFPDSSLADLYDRSPCRWYS